MKPARGEPTTDSSRPVERWLLAVALTASLLGLCSGCGMGNTAGRTGSAGIADSAASAASAAPTPPAAGSGPGAR